MGTGCSMIPVFVDDPNTWTKIQVPQEIVRICENLSQLSNVFDVLKVKNIRNTLDLTMFEKIICSLFLVSEVTSYEEKHAYIPLIIFYYFR